MKQYLIVLGLAVLSSVASAQQTVVVPASKAYRLWPEEVHNYKGEYYLSNGKKMYINRIGNRLYAQIGKQKEHEIQATGEHMFEAVDRSMSLNIVISSQGYVSGRIAYIDEEAPATPLVFASLMTR